MKRFFKWLAAMTTLFVMPIAAMGGCTDTVSYEAYDNAELYAVGAASFSTAEVQELDIDWIGGRIEIIQAETESVQVVEDTGLEQEAERMHYYRDGQVLKVKYCESGLRSTIDTQKKNLRVSVPASVVIEIECVDAVVSVEEEHLTVQEFSLEGVSGSFNAQILDCQGEMEIETVSGKILIGELSAKKLSVESVSGDFSVTKLTAASLEADTVSGTMQFGLQQPITAEIRSTSGDTTFVFLETWGTTVQYSTISGEFHSEKAFEKTGKTYQIGEGTACVLKVNTTSGDLYIE